MSYGFVHVQDMIPCILALEANKYTIQKVTSRISAHYTHATQMRFSDLSLNFLLLTYIELSIGIAISVSSLTLTCVRVILSIESNK